jgi:SAM-dependent methyltransferase
VLEHIEDDRNTLREIREILTPSGEFIISTPYPPAVYPDKYHKREGYTEAQILGLLKSAGFKAIRSDLCMFWISRMVLRFAVNFMSLFKIPPPILPLIELERIFRKCPPFDIVVKAVTTMSGVRPKTEKQRSGIQMTGDRFARRIAD